MVWPVSNINPPQAEHFANPDAWWDLKEFWEAWTDYWAQYDLVITDRGADGLSFNMANGERVLPSLVTHADVERTVGADGARISFGDDGGIVLHGHFTRIATRIGSMQFVVDGETTAITHPVLVYGDRIFVPLASLEGILHPRLISGHTEELPLHTADIAEDAGLNVVEFNEAVTTASVPEASENLHAPGLQEIVVSISADEIRQFYAYFPTFYPRYIQVNSIVNVGYFDIAPNHIYRLDFNLRTGMGDSRPFFGLSKDGCEIGGEGGPLSRHWNGFASDAGGNNEFSGDWIIDGRNYGRFYVLAGVVGGELSGVEGVITLTRVGG